MKISTTFLFTLLMLIGFTGMAWGQVRINEVRADDASTDNVEFIELVGVAGTDLTNYEIKHVNGNGGSQIFSHTIGSFTLPNDGVTDSEANNLGFYVLGVGSFSTGTDESISSSLQNGPEGVILYDDSGNVVDAVAYGSAADVNGDVTTSGSTSADNYLHVTQSDDSGDNSLQAPDDVVGDDGTGWTLAAATIGAINDGQTSGSIVLASSVKAEPANHVTSFTAAGSINSIDLSWTDATGSPTPDAYLVKIHETDYASISAPVDGTAESDDTDLSNGSGVLNITHGTESASFSGLDETTTYYFKIYPYTNSGSDIDYKTNGTVPEDDATTLETPDIVLNEILADPDGDANGDGTTDTGDDEFLEFVNTGSSDLDISNWTIEDAGGTTHTFANPTVLKPMQSVVVFAGGTPTGDFGGSLTQTAGGLSLNNGGDDVILKNSSGVEVINYAYGGATNESETRSPDLTGSFADHTTADSDDGSAFSPGTRIDGSTFQPSVEITGSEGWRILSTPTASNTYDDLLGDFWTQGIATGADATSGTPNVQTYDGSSFSAVSDMGTTMNVGNGFIFYVYSDDDYNESGADAGFPKTLELFAVSNSGSVSPTLTSGADELTLVGNPYYSSIDWDDLGKTDLTGTVYVYDYSYGTPSGNDVAASGSAGSYRTWNGTAGSLNNGLIAPFQGFWVQNASSGTPSLTIEEADQTTGGTFYKGAEDESITIKLRGEMENMFSEAYLSFTEHGVSEKDNYDGLKLSPLDFRDYMSVSTLTGDTKLDINNLPKDFEGTLEIPVSVKGYFADANSGTWKDKAGEVTLSWPEMNNVPENWSVILHDYETGESIDMRTLETYNFSIEGSQQKVTDGPRTTILNPQPPKAERAKSSDEFDTRFMITVTAETGVTNEPTEEPTAFKLQQNYPNPFNPTTRIEYSIAEVGEVTLSIYNVMGQRVETLISEAKSPGTYQVSWNASDMASGIYYYRLETAGQVLTRQMTLIK